MFFIQSEGLAWHRRAKRGAWNPSLCDGFLIAFLSVVLILLILLVLILLILVILILVVLIVLILVLLVLILFLHLFTLSHTNEYGRCARAPPVFTVWQKERNVYLLFIGVLLFLLQHVVK